MAKVEMDASEWEAMKKVEKLLEQALKKEKKMSAKIDKLKEEKIDALKANEKMVTMVNKTEVTQLLCSHVPVNEILSRLYRVMANVANVGARDRARFGHGNSRNYDEFTAEQMAQAWQMSMHSRSGMYVEDDVRRLQDLFFTKETKSFIDKNETTITHKGLDDVKADIAQEYANNMDKTSKKAISDNIELRAEIISRNDDQIELKKALDLNRQLVKDGEKDTLNLSIEIKRLKEEISSFVDKKVVSSTKKILNDTRGFVTNGKRLKELDKLWKKQD